MYKVIKAIFGSLFRWMFRVEVINKEALEYGGSMILMCNHLSGWDPVFLHAISKCKVYFIAKAELFKFAPFGALLRSFGAFPVVRGKGDMGALQNAFTLLGEGKTLGRFPGGTSN